MITQERLKQLFLYDPETGIVTNRVRRSSNSPSGAIVGTPYRGGMGLVTSVDDKLHYVHRLIWILSTGEWPHQVDHRDGNPLNNRWSNLRECTQSQNLMNARKHRRKNPCSSKYKGVWFMKSTKKWIAEIHVNGKKRHLGCFLSEDEAAIARSQAASTLHGEFARVL
jgi:hypothetical protein